jgi:hypothetical protein
MECRKRQSFKSRDRLCRLDCTRTQANKDNAELEKRELTIETFAKRNSWAAAILDPGIRVAFRKAAA